MSDKHAKAGEDLTGRNRFSRNVLFAWAGQCVRIVAGFIIPRMVSDHLGQMSLGIWDFAWSIIGYFGLLQFGMSGSVNRFVARYRATGEREALTRCVSTFGLFLLGAGAAIAVTTLVVVFWVLPAFHDRLGDALPTARLIVLFLGADAAISSMLSTYLGVVSGCHRWDIHNTLNAACYGATMVGMMIVLTLGGGLAWLAFVHLVFSTLINVLRIRIAHRICPELVIRYRTASLNVFVEQARFSAKNIIPYVARLTSGQTSSLLIAGFLGPASLAIFSRPVSLVSQLGVMASKYGMLLIPTASSLQAREDHQALHKTLIETTRGLNFLVLPALLILTSLGDSVIRLWMGANFVCPGLVQVIAVSSFAVLIQEPSWNILVGLSRHGRVSLVQLAGAIVSALLLWAALSVLKCGLVGAAVAIAIPQVIVNGIWTPLAACRFLEISAREFYGRTLLKPLVCVAPLAVFLWCARLTIGQNPLFGLGIVFAGLLFLALTYWRYVLPDRLRQKVIDKCRLPWLGRKAGALK